MKNADQPITPCIMQKTGNDTYRLSKGEDDAKEWRVPMSGLTKREYFAAKAMQGMCSVPNTGLSLDGLVKKSIELANEILTQLEKQ